MLYNLQLPTWSTRQVSCKTHTHAHTMNLFSHSLLPHASHTLLPPLAHTSHTPDSTELLNQMFNLVYDVDVVNELSFYRWRDKGTERFGRGNAVISVKTFFDWLENAETESEGEGEEGGEMR